MQQALSFMHFGNFPTTTRACTTAFRGRTVSEVVKGRCRTWWFTPGGGVEEGETSEAAARRELAEETGFECDGLGPVVLERVTEFEFDGVLFEQVEDYFLVRTATFCVDISRWTPVEVATKVEHRWWTREELEHAPELIYPQGLSALLDVRR